MIAELIIAYNFPVVRFTIYAKSNCMNAQTKAGKSQGRAPGQAMITHYRPQPS